MKISLGCDHGGYALKEHIKAYLESKGHEVVDCGTYSTDSCDYPDYGHALARGMENGECERGIAICGSGEGISMTLNKHQMIRAALVWMPEIARLARQHNDANVLVMPGRFVTEAEATDIVEAFLTTDFEGGRHVNRINKIALQ